MYPLLSAATIDWAKTKFCKAFLLPANIQDYRFSHPLPDTHVTRLSAILWGYGLGNSVTSSASQPNLLACLLREMGAWPPLLTGSLSFPAMCAEMRASESFLDVHCSPPPLSIYPGHQPVAPFPLCRDRQLGTARLLEWQFLLE